ncbi:MAG: hypothetical protein WCR13_03855 [Sphaerochaeta sp.]
MKLCNYLLVSEAFNVQRTHLEEKLEISFSIKNSVAKKEERNLRPVLHDCSCTITSEGNKDDTIFTMKLCYAVWIGKDHNEMALEEPALSSYVASVLKPLVHAEINACLAKVRLPAIAYERLDW